MIEAFGLIGQNIDRGLSYADSSIDDVRKSTEANFKSVISDVSSGNNVKMIENKTTSEK